MGYSDERNINELIGKILLSVDKVGDEELIFHCSDGTNYKMYHNQDCCENVTIEDIVGDLDDLVGSPIIEAEEATSDADPDDKPNDDKYRDSFTWTFYKLATAKGFVTIRWYGESNGHYSESVNFEIINTESEE